MCVCVCECVYNVHAYRVFNLKLGPLETVIIIII